MEHDNQLRDSLFKLTHEIKNPIAVCKGYLDMLDVFTILDTKGKKFVLDTSELEENDKAELIFLIDEFKHHFGRSVFSIRTSVNVSTIVRKVLANCSSYVWNEDGSINIPKVLQPYMGGKTKIELPKAK